MRKRLHIFISSLVTLLLLSLLSAGTFPARAAANFTVSPGVVVYSAIQGNNSSKQLTITNTSGGTISITAATLGGNAPAPYSITGLPALPFDLASGDTENFNVVFGPDVDGVYLAKLTISSNGDNAVVELRGLATKGTGGNNEPSLARIMTTFYGNVNTGLSDLDSGDDDPSTTTIHSFYGGYAPRIGDEIPSPTFVRADTGSPVTLTVLAAYGNTANQAPCSTAVTCWGYYQPGNTNARTEVFKLPNNPSGNNQTLNPVTTGSLSFTPSVEPFGIYTIWPSFGNRLVFSEDQFNDWEPQSGYRHKFRAFPIPGEANAYLVTWEEFTSGFDYNDVVVVMHNVQPATGNPARLRLENLDWQKLIADNSSNSDWLNSYLTFSGIKNFLLQTNPFYHQHREVTLRIHNTSGSDTLHINSISFNPATAWQAKNNEMALTIPPTGSYDLVVKFIEQQGNLGPRYGTMTLTTDDPQNPTKVVNLGASYQTDVENANELDLVDIVESFGFGSNLKKPQPPVNGNYEAFGEEILSKYWHRADTGKPIYVVQLAALHGTGTATIKLIFTASSNSATHDGGNSYQTYFPFNQALTGINEMNINGKNDDFYFNIGGKTACAAACIDQHGIRVWRARDPQGNVMEDAFIVAQDYVGQGGSTNYDWNDNVALITNIAPTTTYNPDLKMNGIATPSTVKIGNMATATFNVFNKYAFPAANVTFTITLPANATYVSHSGQNCTFSAPSTVNCSLGSNFMPNELFPVPISVQFKPTSGTSLKVKGVVATTSPEQSTSNNTTNISFTVGQQFPPVANNDGPYSATMNEELTVPVNQGLLTNDTDANANDTLTAVLEADSNDGTVTINPDGSFSFIPDTNFFGTTTFTYRASDGTDTSDVATATIEVSQSNFVPVAVDDNYMLAEDTPLSVNAANGVLKNDSDQDAGQILTSVLLGDPAHGDVTLAQDGSFSYTPDANYNGTDSFSYTLSDGAGGSDTGTVNLNITPVNDAPDAVSDLYDGNEDQTLTVNGATGILLNDVDVDGDELTITIDVQPTSGDLTMNTNGGFTYVPQADFDGHDGFTYTVSDGNGGSDSAGVTIDMLGSPDVPKAHNDTYGTTKNVNLEVTIGSGVLANDTDPDTGDVLTATVDTQPTHGTLTLNTDGSLTYVPATDYVGGDSFTYVVTDSTNNTDSATVTLNVIAINQAPVAVNDDYETVQNQELVVSTANGVLLNDTDPDNNPLTVTLETPPTHGTVELDQDGGFTYTPESDYIGSDEFHYIVDDGQGGTDSGKVTITVIGANVPPVAVDDGYTTAMDTQLIVPVATGVLVNDTDANVGDVLSASVATNPTNGALNLNSDGSFTYTPNSSFVGDDSFTYTVSDGNGGTATGTVNLSVTETGTLTDLITNGGFETDAEGDKVPDGWTAKNLTGDKRKCNTPEKQIAFEGVCAFMFKGKPGENSKLQQIVDGSSLVNGDTLTLYAAVSGKKVVDGKARIIVKVIYAASKDKLILNFAGGTYTYPALGQLPNDSTTVGETPTKIKAQIQYKRGGNSGKWYIDAVKLLVNDPIAAVASGLNSRTGNGNENSDSNGVVPLPGTKSVDLPSSLSGRGGK